MKALLTISLSILAVAGVFGCGTTKVAPTIVTNSKPAPKPVPKPVINATVAAAAVKKAVEKSTSQKVAFSHCPSNVTATPGATIDCTVRAVNGAMATVTLQVQPGERVKVVKFVPAQPPGAPSKSP